MNLSPYVLQLSDSYVSYNMMYIYIYREREGEILIETIHTCYSHKGAIIYASGGNNMNTCPI